MKHTLWRELVLPPLSSFVPPLGLLGLKLDSPNFAIRFLLAPLFATRLSLLPVRLDCGVYVIFRYASQFASERIELAETGRLFRLLFGHAGVLT